MNYQIWICAVSGAILFCMLFWGYLLIRMSIAIAQKESVGSSIRLFLVITAILFMQLLAERTLINARYHDAIDSHYTFYIDAQEIDPDNIDILQYKTRYDDNDKKVFLMKPDPMHIPILIMPHF